MGGKGALKEKQRDQKRQRQKQRETEAERIWEKDHTEKSMKIKRPARWLIL